MKNLILIFLGGGLGSVARYALSIFYNKKWNNFPLGTFLANALGCLFIGLLLGYFLKQSQANNQYKLLFIVGFCGGFTTMSSFSAELIEYLRNGQMILFLIYLGITILLCLLFTSLGYLLAK